MPRPHVVVVGIVVLLAGCTPASRSELPEVLAARLGPLVHETVDGDSDPEDVWAAMDRAVAEVERPDGVAGLAPGHSLQLGDDASGGAGLSFSVVVEPTDGAAHCVLVGVAGDGRTEGARARGDVDAMCAEAEPIEPTGPLLDGWRRHPG